MSFDKLKVPELVKVADYFVVDIQSVDPEKVTKKEVLAALASGDKPVTWDDYENIYLPAQAEEVEESEETIDLTAVDIKKPVEKEVDESTYILIRMDRANPRFDIRGYTFTKEHPFRNVDPESAKWITKNVEGFRYAAPVELEEFYN